MKGTGEIREVTNNVAFDLVDRELAEVLTRKKAKIKPVIAPITEDKKINPKSYLNRQFNTSRRDKRFPHK